MRSEGLEPPESRALILAVEADAAAQAALNGAVHHAKTRVHRDFHRSLAEYPILLHSQARDQIHADSARAMNSKVARTTHDYYPRARALGELLFDPWEVKTHAVDVCIEVRNTAFQVMGGMGYKRGKTERLLRDGRVGAVMGSTNEVC